jgi:hypothetical protein
MIFAGDVIIAEAIRQGLEDMRKNLWLLDDVFASFITEPALKNKYGQKEIDAAKDWFANNKIEVNLKFRNDKEHFPCVTIALGSSTEKEEMKHLGDLSTEIETLMPNKIGKPIPYIVKPFVPESYNPATGILTFPSSVKKRGVRPGQILVDPDTGNGYIIQEVTTEGVRLEQNLNLTLTRAGVVPKYQIYRARREHSFFQETYSIGCHVHGDPAPLLWLHAIVLYTILRYRESLLEGRQFMQSSVSSSDLIQNPNFDGPGGENVFSRYITLTGQVEHSWLKTPYRIIEAIELGEETENGFRTGIKIHSNLDSPDSLNTEDDMWITTDGNDEDDED